MPGVRLLSQLVDAARIVSGEIDGSRPALTDGSVGLTWQEYVDAVARLAGVLQMAGVRPGDRVGVRLPKSCASFVAVHAVVRSGGIMVPLDALAPIDVAASVVEDAGIEVVITDAATARDAATLTSVRALILPGVAGWRATGSADGRVAYDQTDIDAAEPLSIVDVEPDAPAYVIYTSGSTGQPKGIVHTHASALAYAHAAADEYDLRSDDRFANIAPLHFDQSTFELYAAPLVGGCVLVVPDPVLRFPASVSQLVERERITIWYSVPFLLEQLAERGVLEERDLSSLRWVLFGGESFPHRALSMLMRLLPGVAVSNVYGPAEVNQCTAYRVAEPPDGPVPIGAAWPAARLRLADPDDLSVEARPGSIGILLVASATMMLGYWNRPDLTAAALVADPDGTVWYVTGDLARSDERGILTFLGRVDNQVKVRGYRIELEAVDAVVRDTPGVHAGTVVVDRRTAGGDRLIALVELDPMVSPDSVVTAVAELARRRLPRHAAPSEIRVVTCLPRTSSGKVDRTAAADLLAHHP